MYLLKPTVYVSGLLFPSFTFHYVSIKTFKQATLDINLKSFTFHYVSIKTKQVTKGRMLDFNLHSTMYLLKHKCGVKLWLNVIHLHSTMYLLKQEHGRLYHSIRRFTFHYVSIKTPAIVVQIRSKDLIYIPLCIY